MAHATSSDPNVFILPDLGEGVHEAELIKWRVSVGDNVQEHDILAEMETDKALVEVPSPRDGVIAILHGSEGEICNVGEPLVTYNSDGSTSVASTPQPKSETAPSSSTSSNSESEDAGTVVGTMSGSLGAVSGQDGKALATPAVRRLARDLGVNIDSIQGSGIAGRVTERDVRAAADIKSAPPPATRRTPPPAPRPSQSSAQTHLAEQTVAEEVSSAALATRLAATGSPAPITSGAKRIPFRGTRRIIANRLRESMDTAVHFTVMDEAEVSALDRLRKQSAAASGEKISYLPFVVSALCRAMRQFPALNATVDDEREEIVQHPAVHVGIATDTEHGLSVPVVPNADALGVLEIGRHIAELARMTRDRSIPRDRLMGSTITISNVGSYAGRFATPVINYPEVAILAVGRVREGVVADNGAIRIGKLLPLSLACDHRVVDGAEGARCLAHIIELLGNPQSLMTPARG